MGYVPRDMVKETRILFNLMPIDHLPLGTYLVIYMDPVDTGDKLDSQTLKMVYVVSKSFC